MLGSATNIDLRNRRRQLSWSTRLSTACRSVLLGRAVDALAVRRYLKNLIERHNRIIKKAAETAG